MITLYKLAAGKYEELTEFVKVLGGEQQLEAKAARKSQQDLLQA